MADISLRIKSDFAQAEKDFQSLGASSEALRAQIEKFSAGFKTEQIDKFIDRNRLSAVAVSATSGKLAGMQKEASGLQREIQRLISKGMDPNSASLKKLQAEYLRVNSNMGQMKQSAGALNGVFGKAVKSLGAMVAAYVSWRAAAGFIKSITTDLATYGDELAKTSRRMGVTVETLQELNYAAERSGVSTEELNKSLEQMNKAVGQASQGQGALYTYLSKTDQALLNQVTEADNAEEAFNILTSAIGNMKNPLDQAALASAAFGRSGQGIITMTENGAEGLAALREEAGKYGNIMSTEVAEASERFKDAQLNVSAALKGVALSIGVNLLDPLAKGMQAFAVWASEGDRLYKILTVMGKIIAVVGPAIVAYMVYTKALAAVTWAMTAAQQALNLAMSLNPVGLIIAAIAALIAIGILLYKNWDVVKVKMISGAEQMKLNMMIAWEYIKIGFLRMAQALIKGMMLIYTPWFWMIDKIIGAFNRMTGKDIPLLSTSVKKFAAGFDKTIANSGAKINQLQKEKAKKAAESEKAQKEANKKIKESENSRVKNAKNNTNALAAEDKKRINSARNKEITFKQILENIAISEQAANRAQASEAQKFWEDRAAMEGTNHESRMEWLASQQAQILELEGLTNQERLNAAKGLSAAMAAEEKRMWDTKVEFMQYSLATTSSMVADLQTIFKNAGKESRELAIFAKAVAIGEATINSYLAFTKALASFPPPMNYVAAGITLAAGLAKVGAIATTPIPTAQTGINYTVPDTPMNRNDGHAVSASAGEQVSVTPRGMAPNNGLTEINIQVGEEVIYRVVQKGIDRGKINLSNKQLGRGVFA